MNFQSGFNSNQENSKKCFPIKVTQIDKIQDNPQQRTRGRLMKTHHFLNQKDDKDKQEDLIRLKRKITDLNLELRSQKNQSQQIESKIVQATQANIELGNETTEVAYMIENLNEALESLEIQFLDLDIYIQGENIHKMERDIRFQHLDIYDHQGRLEMMQYVEQQQKQAIKDIQYQIQKEEEVYANMEGILAATKNYQKQLEHEENKLNEQKQKIEKENKDSERIKLEKKFETMIYSEILHAQKQKPRHYLLVQPTQQEDIVVNLFNIQDTRCIKLENNEFKNVDFRQNLHRQVIGMNGRQQKQQFQFDFIFQQQKELISHLELFIIGSLYTNLNPIYKQNGTGDYKSYEQFYRPTSKISSKFENMEQVQSSQQPQIIILSDKDYGLILNIMEYAFGKLVTFSNQFVQVDKADISIDEIMDNSYDVKNLYKEEDYNTFKNHYDKLNMMERHYRFTINCQMKDQTLRKLNIIVLCVKQLRIDIFGKMYKAAIFKTEKMSYPSSFYQLFKYSKCLILTNIPQFVLENEIVSYKSIRQILEIQSHMFFQQDLKDKNKMPPSKENQSSLLNQPQLIKKY